MEKKRILIADDEERIVALVSDFLTAAGFETEKAFDGETALNKAKEGNIDLAILDIMMPALNGWEVTKKIREFSDMPIIILSARSEEFDLLEGFSVGADEYVTKPFSPAVLVKRVEALLKRSGKIDEKAAKKGLVVDKESFTAFLDGKELELTLKEFGLLSILYENKGMVLSRDQLLDSVWSYDYDGDLRTVDSHIARLRTKLGDFGSSHLKTIYGMGYKLEP
ncbi:MAG: response regulator transcription factor [Clostridia bacterium]|nr:response regulator transcription factor [Clostridia bacterium]